jgi:hypothetical protein
MGVFLDAAGRFGPAGQGHRDDMVAQNKFCASMGLRGGFGKKGTPFTQSLKGIRLVFQPVDHAFR